MTRSISLAFLLASAHLFVILCAMEKRQKWAIVTGASSGIGQATARALADAGYAIYLVGRRQDRLKQVQSEIKSQSKVIVLDLRNKSEVDDFIQSEAQALTAVTLLVNNAGLAKGVDKIQNSAVADWEEMIDTNLKGLLYFTRGILPFFINQKQGHIVNLGSVAGRWTYPGGAVYCATKFAVRAFTEGLRLDLMGTPIRVTNIEPGMVNTEFSLVRTGDQKLADSLYEGMTPLKAEDIADTILWCVNRPAHVNIQELVIFPTDQAAVGPGYVTRHSGN